MTCTKNIIKSNKFHLFRNCNILFCCVLCYAKAHVVIERNNTINRKQFLFFKISHCLVSAVVFKCSAEYTLLWNYNMQLFKSIKNYLEPVLRNFIIIRSGHNVKQPTFVLLYHVCNYFRILFFKIRGDTRNLFCFFTNAKRRHVAFNILFEILA